MRTFDTGATRDVDNNKFDYEGFLSPIALQAYAVYMHKNRVQKDGQLRDSDNWQKGIPADAYMKSLFRHFMDVWMHHRGFGYKSNESYRTALCAMLFNVQGLLHEEIKHLDQNIDGTKADRTTKEIRVRPTDEDERFRNREAALSRSVGDEAGDKACDRHGIHFT
jgi:hypothetical protein